ncbi:hypothetical protein AB1Y20_003051 [Prymnesium parvum]|uniref:Uncharacterized protein n=1 Tax=Prymnesium parvum TaxID=97485 RepID=A0AB34JDG6_PRYPA
MGTQLRGTPPIDDQTDTPFVGQFLSFNAAESLVSLQSECRPTCVQLSSIKLADGETMGEALERAHRDLREGAEEARAPLVTHSSPHVVHCHRHWREELRDELKHSSLPTQTLLAPCLILNALQTALHLMRLPPQEIELLDPPLRRKVVRYQENAERMGLRSMLAASDSSRNPPPRP